MSNQTKISKALETLKKIAGEDWPQIKKYLVRFLDTKREIGKSNLDKKIERYLLNLAFRDIRCAMTMTDATLGCLSYALNSLSTLHKIPYDSGLMCFINDSYAKGKSGNKKYPNLC